MVEELSLIYQNGCTLRPPLPPQPKPPPPPPVASPLPPEVHDAVIRRADQETEFDADCLPIDYATCQKIVAQFAAEVGAPNAVFSGKLDVSLAPCEGLDSDVNCFKGCGFGSTGVK